MSAPYDTSPIRATILRHIDGDTTWIAAHLHFDLTLNMTVRWWGLNAPEKSTPEGKAALAWVEQQMPAGSDVVFQSYRDSKEKFGRFLGEFFVNGVNLNQAMIAAGFAVPYDGGKR